MKAAKWVACIVGPILLFYLFCLNHVEPSQIGIAQNSVSGKLWIQTEGGWYLTWPWVRVARIDTRPVRVGVESGGRGYSARLVRFEPLYWKEFVTAEGFRYYWWSNRLSFNISHDEEYRGMRDILRGYAYSPHGYPFVTVITEYNSR